MEKNHGPWKSLTPRPPSVIFGNVEPVAVEMATKRRGGDTPGVQHLQVVIKAPAHQSEATRTKSGSENAKKLPKRHGVIL